MDSSREEDAPPEARFDIWAALGKIKDELVPFSSQVLHGPLVRLCGRVSCVRCVRIPFSSRWIMAWQAAYRQQSDITPAGDRNDVWGDMGRVWLEARATQVLENRRN